MILPFDCSERKGEYWSINIAIHTLFSMEIEGIFTFFFFFHLRWKSYKRYWIDFFCVEYRLEKTKRWDFPLDFPLWLKLVKNILIKKRNLLNYSFNFYYTIKFCIYITNGDIKYSLLIEGWNFKSKFSFVYDLHHAQDKLNEFKQLENVYDLEK